MIYPEKESFNLEFKESLPSKQQILNTVIGFCNLFGGRIIIGVNDKRKIIGISEDDIDETIDVLQRSIHENSTPPILPAFYTQRIDGKFLLIIEVSSGMNKPYFKTNDGMSNGTFIRIGSQTIRATSEMIEELKWRSRGHYLDEFPVYHAREADIDQDAFKEFLINRKVSTGKKKISELMLNYEVTIKEHTQTYPTTGGLLLFGNNPQQFIKEGYIICTHFKGNEGREVLATRDCTGSLFQQYEDALAFVQSRLNRKFTITGAKKRNEQLEIPDQAIRETLLNSVVHRNYFLPGPIKVAIYDNRIEIFSPGNFPGPLRTDELEMGITYIRNAVITKIFRESGYIEKLGSGFRSIFESYRKQKLPKPVILEGTGFIKCILPRAAAGKARHLSEEKEELLRLFLIADEVKTSDVIKTLGVSRATAVRLLSDLVKKKIIKRIGKGPSTVYLKDRNARF